MHDYGSPVRTESTVELRMMAARSENVCVIGIASPLKLASESLFVQSQSRRRLRHPVSNRSCGSAGNRCVELWTVHGVETSNRPGKFPRY
jgi:hypothetical protein